MQPVITAKKPVQWLIDNIGSQNIAEDLEQSVLDTIGVDVHSMYEVDKNSRVEWEELIDRGLAIAKQVCEKKSYPWDNAANTKDPLIAVAAMQFAARAGAEVVKGTDVVKTKATGNDPQGLKEQRGKRVSQFMSYQLVDHMTEWLDDTDQLLLSISPIGMYYKKTYWDDIAGRPKSLAVSPKKVVVNNDAKRLEEAERVTEEMEFCRNEIVSRIRAGRWIDIQDALKAEEESGEQEEFIESHTWYDLDGDGYKEPYVITVHCETQKVVRILARYEQSGIATNDKKEIISITPIQYFTLFPFIPAFDAKYHKTGFCQLLTPLTEEINTLQNQLIDAGTLANLGGGFIGKGAKIPSGGIRMKLGQWIPVESPGSALRENLFPNPAKEPSAVLFQLLARLDDKAQKLASISDTVTGDLPTGHQAATSIMAALDQGLKVYSSILLRLFRAFKAEFEKIYRLNYLHLTDKEYTNVIDITKEEFAPLQLDPNNPRALVEHDFNPSDCDITPVLDPQSSSEALRLARAGALLQAEPGNPEVKRDYYKAIGVPQDRINAYVPQESPPNPAMIKLQADMVEKQQKGKLEERRLKLDAAKLDLEEYLAPAKREVLIAQALNLKATAEANIAKSESTQVMTHINHFKAELDSMRFEMEQLLAQQTAVLEAEEEGDNDRESGTDGSGIEPGAANDMAASGADAEGAELPPMSAAGVTGDTGSGTGEPFTGSGRDEMGELGGSNSGSGSGLATQQTGPTGAEGLIA